MARRRQTKTKTKNGVQFFELIDSAKERNESGGGLRR